MASKSIKSILKYMVASNNMSSEERDDVENKAILFTVKFNNIFEGLDYYMFEYLKESIIMHDVLTPELLDTMMVFNLKEKLATHKVRTTSTQAIVFTNTSDMELAVQSVRVEMNEYISALLVATRDDEFNRNNFKADLLSTKSDFLNAIWFEGLMQSVTILDGSGPTKVNDLTGSVDSMKSAVVEYDNISNMFDEMLTTNEKVDTKKSIVTSFGIDSIDEIAKGIWTHEVTTITATPSGGKTTLTLLGPVYNAITKYKKNVLFFSVEQPAVELQDKMVAKFVKDHYGYMLVSRDIQAGEYDSNHEVKQAIETARLLLFDDDLRDSDYGKIVFPEFKNIYSNTLVAEIRAQEAKHRCKFDIIVVDYMSQLEHKYKKDEYGRLDRSELSKECYSNAKFIALAMGKAFIAIEQLNKEGIAAAELGREVLMGMLAGGVNGDRYSDSVYAFSATKAEKENGILYSSGVKTRNTEPIPRRKHKVNFAYGEVQTIEGDV